MDYKQNEWLYDILRKHGFDEAVQAFKDNIAALGFDGKLAHWVGEEVAKLDIATVSREEYVKNRLAEWEREMLEGSISQASAAAEIEPALITFRKISQVRMSLWRLIATPS